MYIMKGKGFIMLVFKGIVEVLFAMVVVDRVITEVHNAFSKSK